MHPSSGVLQVLASEVPDVVLDSMRWRVHTWRSLPEPGTYTSVVITGRIVSTRLVSLVGVGVLIEGLRDSSVVHRMIDSEFYVGRQDPVFSGVGTTVTLERVHPERPVPVVFAEKQPGTKAPPSWGCPMRARIVRLSINDAVRREALIPNDERPTSDHYPWDPRTFDVDSALANEWGAFALLEGPHADSSSSDFVIVRSKVLYRTIEHGAMLVDSTRLSLADMDRLARTWGRVHPAVPYPAPTARIGGPPSDDSSAVVIRRANLLIERRFPTNDPPADVAPLLAVLSEIRARSAARAKAADR